MGRSINAYYYIDQEEVDNFIKGNNIDIKNNDDIDMIKTHIYKKCTGNSILPRHKNDIIFGYDRDNETYYLINYYQCNCILRHKLLKNYDKDNMSNCLYWLIRPEHATKVSNNLRENFPDDEILMNFTDWLDRTSKYCYRYELSY